MSKRPVERRPGVFVFEDRTPHRERVRWTIGYSVAAAILLAGSGMLFIVPGLGDAVRVDLTALCFVLSWLPLFFIVMTWIVPPQAVRVSPRGIWHAQTGWRPMRRSMRWRHVSRVRWATPITLESKTGKRVIVPTVRQGRAVCRAIEPILSQRFDLRGGTVEQQRHDEMARWSITRRVADKALLIGIALWMVLFPVGGVVLTAGGPNQLSWPALVYLATWASISFGVMFAWRRRQSVRGWLSRIR